MMIVLGLVDGKKGDVMLRTGAGSNVRAGGMTAWTGMAPERPGACSRSVGLLGAEAGAEGGNVMADDEMVLVSDVVSELL